jgi:BirA family transcriptional regulator, biotin operon repressor / biotin---[acetyl-CoA-carboxylase] ligase
MPLFCADMAKAQKKGVMKFDSAILDAEQIQAGLAQCIGMNDVVHVEWYPSLGSTNEYLIADDRPTPAAKQYWLVGTSEQTNGRGRQRKRWTSVAADCLTFSIRLPLFSPKALWTLPSLPLALGLAVAESLDRWLAKHALRDGVATFLPTKLKWPNDVLIDGGKVAGILIESRGMVVFGVGINLRLSDALAAQVVRSPGAVPIAGLVPPGAEITISARADLVAMVVDAVVRADDEHRLHGLLSSKRRWLDRHAYAEQNVTVFDAGLPILHGKVQGLGESGELLLLDEHGKVHKVLSGDLSLRLQAS